MKKVIKCGQFFDSNTGKVLKDIAVVIDGNKITEVAPAADVCCKDAEVIDLSGKFVMPGLIDAHVHINICLLYTSTAPGPACFYTGRSGFAAVGRQA